MRYGVKMTTKKLMTAFGAGLGAVVAITALAVGPTVSAATSTVTVTGNTSAGENQPGWLFNRDLATQTPYEFNSNAASIGEGSLYVKPITNTLGTPPARDKFVGEYFANAFVANVDSFSYDFQIGDDRTAADAKHFYLNVYANFGESADTKFYDCRYNVVPTVGTVGDFTTVTFDPTQAYPVDTRSGAVGTASPYACPAVPADMDLFSPSSTIRAFALNVGDTSATDTGVNGYLDNVVLTLNNDTTVFDFEPVLTPATKDACKNGDWETFNTPEFKNQGDCVSFVASKGRSNN